MISVNKVETDNPFVDLLVYYTKLISLNLVIKNNQFAEDNETIISSRESDMYIACYEHTAQIGLFSSCPESILIACGVPDNGHYNNYKANPSTIPFDFRYPVLRMLEDNYVANYEEKNAYYRELNGLPSIEDIGLATKSLSDPSVKNPLIDVSEYLKSYGVTGTLYIHECNESQLSVLVGSGVLDTLIKENPDKGYLNNIRDGRIDVYNARKAERFQILRIIEIDNAEILETYKTKYELARDYTMKTVYSDAYEFQSDYYDAFITVFIIIQTMVDMIVDVQSMIARKDVFDSRSIKWMFQSYGIPYYDEIPIKYQKRMLNNLHTLLKYKSSTQNIVDICSLFGFDDIQVFKYYLLRYRKMDEYGEYSDIKDDEGNDDPIQNFDLKFIRVPIDEFNANKYAKDVTTHVDYEDLAYNDAYWQEDGKQEEIKNAILREEFTLERDKYLSIDLMYNLSQLSFDVPYFYSMILDKWNGDIEQMVIPYIRIPYIGQNSYKLVDIIIYLISLSYEYYGFKDSIQDETVKAMKIYGFNFGVDLNTLINDISTKAADNRIPLDIIKSLDTSTISVSDFLLKPGADGAKTITYNQLLEVFNTNKKVYDLVVYGMRTANNKKIYDIYKTIYDSLMVIDKSYDFFMTNGEMPGDPFETDTSKVTPTYAGYLKRKSEATDLFKSLETIHNITDMEVKKKNIKDVMNSVTQAMEEYLDSEEYKYIYSVMPANTANVIQQYMMKIINFFKSFRIDIAKLGTVYKLDDKFNNLVRFIDDLQYDVDFTKNELIPIFDYVDSLVTLTKSEKIAMLEKLDISRHYISEYEFTDKINLTDKMDTMVNLFMYDYIKIREKLEIEITQG